MPHSTAHRLSNPYPCKKIVAAWQTQYNPCYLSRQNALLRDNLRPRTNVYFTPEILRVAYNASVLIVTSYDLTRELREGWNPTVSSKVDFSREDDDKEKEEILQI